MRGGHAGFRADAPGPARGSQGRERRGRRRYRRRRRRRKCRRRSRLASLGLRRRRGFREASSACLHPGAWGGLRSVRPGIEPRGVLRRRRRRSRGSALVSSSSRGSGRGRDSGGGGSREEEGPRRAASSCFCFFCSSSSSARSSSSSPPQERQEGQKRRFLEAGPSLALCPLAAGGGRRSCRSSSGCSGSPCWPCCSFFFRSPLGLCPPPVLRCRPRSSLGALWIRP